MAFTGLIGAVVATPNVWTKVNSISAELDAMFTATATMVYSPGFTTRELSDPPLTVYETNDDGIKVPVSGDDSVVCHLVAIPNGVDVNNRAAIQPYLQASRYELNAVVVRQQTGLLMPAGYDVYVWASKADLTVNLFGVEGTPRRFKRAAT
jgi:hypothetical protein